MNDAYAVISLAVCLMLIVLPLLWKDHESCKPLCRLCRRPATMRYENGTPVCLECYQKLNDLTKE